MSLLTPTSAPIVHLELLPSRAKAVRVTASNAAIRIACWSTGEFPMETDGSGANEETFIETNCNDCQWYREEIENYADGYEQVNGATLIGTYYTEPPCPCYNNGLSDVSFPCEEGYNFDSDECHTELNVDYLRMDLTFDPKYFYIKDNFGILQGCTVDDNGNVLISPQFSAVNCFNDDKVCWGDNSMPNNLAECFTIYTESEANQDLTSFTEHEDNASAIARSTYTVCADAIALKQDVDTPKALVVASSRRDPSAFLLIAASGGLVSRYTASVPVYYYPNVEVRPGTTCNVWATDVLVTNTRLLFMQQFENDETTTLFLGQVPSNFSLAQCKSQLPQSSEQAEPVNT